MSENNRNIPWPAIMTDLETAGNGPCSAILSIGAVAFDPMTNEPVEDLPAFYHNVELQSCIDAKLVVDGSTIMWWLGQSEQARAALKDPAPISLMDALANFHAWAMGFCDLNEVEFWAHATFDPVILRSAFDCLGLGAALPWKYRNTRDIRTLVGFAKQLGIEIPKSGGDNSNKLVNHQAVDDCRYQVGYVRKLYQEIIGRNLAMKEVA